MATRFLRHEVPEYPDWALEDGLKATVVIEVTIGADGIHIACVAPIAYYFKLQNRVIFAWISYFYFYYYYYPNT